MFWTWNSRGDAFGCGKAISVTRCSARTASIIQSELLNSSMLLYRQVVLCMLPAFRRGYAEQRSVVLPQQSSEITEINHLTKKKIKQQSRRVQTPGSFYVFLSFKRYCCGLRRYHGGTQHPVPSCFVLEVARWDLCATRGYCFAVGSFFKRLKKNRAPASFLSRVFIFQHLIVLFWNATFCC